MLNPSTVINFVKLNLGVPLRPVEHSDQTILDYICTITIPTFSRYAPFKKHTILNSPQVYTDANNNTYFILDDSDAIINVITVTTSLSNRLMSGEPWVIYVGQNEAQDLTMQYAWVDATKVYSPLNFSFEYIPPNQLYLYPTYLVLGFSGSWGVEYATYHKKDFSSIPPALESTFLQLAASDVLSLIANIREQYGDLPTPFGTIPLNGDKLNSKAQEFREQALKVLENLPPSRILTVF